MQLIHFCLFLTTVSVVSATDYIFNATNNPIRFVRTSNGQGNRERITYLQAVIYPRHLTFNARVNFPRSGEFERRYQAIRATGDERGHLVASQFSGPPTWYNLSPQSPRVNRNADYQALTTDWYTTECEVRNYLAHGGQRFVIWMVRMTYVADSNRPDTYRLMVLFGGSSNSNYGAIDTTMHNPFLREDSRFWICRGCRSNNHDHDDLRRRSTVERSCIRTSSLQPFQRD